MVVISRKSSLVKNIFIYGVGTSMSKLMSLLLVGLYTAYISPGDFGYYDIAITTLSALTPIVSLQITDALYRFLLDSNNNEQSGKAVTCAFVMILAGLSTSLLVFSLINFNVDIRFGWIMPAYLSSSVLFSFCQQTVRGLKRNSLYALSGMVYTGVMLLANVVLIVFRGLGVEALFYSVMIADAVGILLLEITGGVFSRIRFSLFSSSFLKDMCRYSVPLLPSAVTYWALMLFNRYAINFFVSPEANGFFAAASKFPALLMTVYGIFALAWQENAILEYDSRDCNDYYTKTFRLYSRLLYCVILLLLPLTRHLVSFLIDSSYYQAWRYIPLLYLGSMFQAFANFYATGYMGAKKTVGAFVTTLAGVAGGALLCVLLIDSIGVQAASLAHMSAFLLMWLLRIWHLRKYVAIRLELPVLASLTLLTCAYIYCCFLSNMLIDVIMLVTSAILFFVLNRELIKIMLGMVADIRKRKNIL